MSRHIWIWAQKKGRDIKWSTPNESAPPNCYIFAYSWFRASCRQCHSPLHWPHGAHRKGKKRFFEKCGIKRGPKKRRRQKALDTLGSHHHFLGHHSSQVHPTTPALLGFPWEACGLLWSLGCVFKSKKIHIWYPQEVSSALMGSRGEWNVFGGSIENRSERKEKCVSIILWSVRMLTPHRELCVCGVYVWVGVCVYPKMTHMFNGPLLFVCVFHLKFISERKRHIHTCVCLSLAVKHFIYRWEKPHIYHTCVCAHFYLYTNRIRRVQKTGVTNGF